MNSNACATTHLRFDDVLTRFLARRSGEVTRLFAAGPSLTPAASRHKTGRRVARLDTPTCPSRHSGEGRDRTPVARRHSVWARASPMAIHGRGFSLSSQATDRKTPCFRHGVVERRSRVTRPPRPDPLDLHHARRSSPRLHSCVHDRAPCLRDVPVQRHGRRVIHRAGAPRQRACRTPPQARTS